MNVSGELEHVIYDRMQLYTPCVDDLYGPPIGTESPRGINNLIHRLDRLLPGIRLKEKLNALDATSHQRIADILALDGLFTLCTLPTEFNGL